eukprot:216019-Lingulodinium_polyedra.AAC.1
MPPVAPHEPDVAVLPGATVAFPVAVVDEPPLAVLPGAMVALSAGRGSSKRRLLERAREIYI